MRYLLPFLAIIMVGCAMLPTPQPERPRKTNWEEKRAKWKQDRQKARKERRER